ncbi:muts domain V-domain-containing protein [Mycena alexandri]|uniref:MutS protein homolog 3 n=1 Tax=Mycena alexandri TaxID=1745969 RepID=A0AAD6TI11_9AGAR|nr:muts domain V-domain-containing protein [Mycena alexandri]
MNSSSPARQAKISTFFSPGPPKRSASGITQNGDASSEPPLKKHKSGDSKSLQPVASSSQGRAEQWRFSSEKEISADPDFSLSSSNTRPRGAFKAKLLSGKFISKAPPASVSADAKSSNSDSDAAFEELSEFFSAKSGKGQKKKATRQPVEELGANGKPLTPLEKQVIRLKKDNPGVLLMVEVGYKYIFFEDDAKVAAKELGMVCFLPEQRALLVASIPTPRRDIHLKKLLSQGYKVGIVQQVETAALKKAGDNRNTPFERKLVHLFTAATYVDDLNSVEDEDKFAAPRLICIIEGKSTAPGLDVCIGMVLVSASVGDVVWDVFDDSVMRVELETRLVHSKPTELLIQRNGLSKSTDKMLKHFADAPSTSAKIRTEYFDNALPFSEAFDFVSQFFSDSGGPQSDQLLATITDFPKPVVIALACTIRYLSAFDIAATLSQTSFFTKFTTKSHMLLTGNTLANLEILQNSSDYTSRGSLIWILDKTTTPFGARMLRNWVGNPLVDKSALQLRIEAVEEIIESSSDILVTLRQLLKRLPDLAKGLCRIQYKQCTPQELGILLSAFYKIGNAFAAIKTPADVGLKSQLLNEIILALPPLKNPMSQLLDAINLKQAAEGRKDCMWRDSSKYPLVEDNILAIQAIEVEINQELISIRKTLRMPSLKWSTCAGEEYLIEVKKSDKRPIPDAYHPAVSKTKYFERYRSPVVTEKLRERALYTESLQIEAKKAFLDFLGSEVGAHYAILRDAVNKLAIADCLLSLALVALRDNYVKPEFTDGSDTLEIVDGRHPMVEALRSDPFVPNSLSFSNDSKSKVITGPNMGGKSSCVRMVALISIMAQIGSYVPAKSVKLGMLDSVLTRMGAYDEIARGRSTFMVEMTETSEILRGATSNSLVILDELGRGTSTFDGMAIAYAVLNQLVASTQCKTLFITHYPLVASELEKKFPDRVQNIHVGYHSETSGVNGRRDVTFLYRLTSGIAPDSFGVECARLAGLPESILSNATKHSSTMELTVAARAKRNMSLRRLELLKNLLQEASSHNEAVEENIGRLRSLIN